MTKIIFTAIFILCALNTCKSFIFYQYGGKHKIKIDIGGIHITCYERQSDESIYEFFDEIIRNRSEIVDIGCKLCLLNCSFPQHFSTITRGILKPFRLFTKTNMKEITSQTFDETLNITSFNFLETKMSKIDENAFANLKDLQSLSIVDSKLSSLPEHIFKFNSRFKIFYMDKNRAKMKLKGKIFANLPALKQVIFEDSNVELLTDDVFLNSSNIEQINFRGNKLETIAM